MRLFPRKKKQFFSEEERLRIVEAIRQAELQTSGEVRVFVESKCKKADVVQRTMQLFFNLKMDKTLFRNAVLIYIAMEDHKLAIFGDEGIHKKVGEPYWEKEVQKMISNFNQNNYAEGISQCVTEVGKALHVHFPFDRKTDKNELPDDLVFGS